MKQVIFAAFLGMAMFFGLNADAQTRINNTQYNQQQRIKHGIKSGQLTRHEARQLRMQQAKVRHYKRMAMADGRVTPRERHLIRHTQKMANRNIYYKKHNKRDRY